jgi:DNA-binding beta-propeller fold protein YncE
VTAETGTLPAGAPPVVETDPEQKRRRRKILILLLLIGSLALLLGIAIWYLLFRQPLPLPIIPPPSVPSYSTSIYGAADPSGVAVSPAGDRIYVAETGGDRVVRIFDAGGNELGVLQPPAESGAEHVPVYVAVDPTNADVYVSDRPAGAVYVYDRDGTFKSEFRPAVAIEGWQPLGLTFDVDGNLYVTDLAAPARVLEFDASGKLLLTLGAAEGLNFPNGVAVDADGLIYVTDSNNGRLLVFGADGALLSKIGRGAGAGNLGLPRGIAIDGQGRAFVVDSSGQGVLVYRALVSGQEQPEHLGFFGGHGIADGQFAFPMGVAVDAHGRVYVADTANGRIQVWSY